MLNQSWIEETFSTLNVPGAVIAAVWKGNVSVQPYGVRQSGDSRAVTENTVFSIASCSKAFTAAVVARLVDEGKLDFDERVCEVLPELVFDDPWITEHVTLRDLLAMRLGLFGVGVPHWGQNRDLPLARVFARVQCLPRLAGFREGFTYLNTAYVAAAEYASRRSGESFDACLKSRILDPLNMQDTFLDENPIPQSRNIDIAIPHADIDGNAVPLSEPRCGGRTGDSCMYVSGHDAANWLAFNLSGKTAGGETLVSETVRSQLYSDQTVGRPEPLPGQHFLTYCMGWQGRDFHGRRILVHEGGDVGVRSHTILCPEEEFGVAVYAALPSPIAVKSTSYRLLSQVCGTPETHWLPSIRKQEESMVAMQLQMLDQQCPLDSDGVIPKRCTGVFESPANGRVRIVDGSAGLEMRFDDAELFDAALKPLGGEVFGVRCYNPAVEEQFRNRIRIRLHSDSSGTVTGVSVPSMAAVFSKVD